MVALFGSLLLTGCEFLPQPARVKLAPDEVLRISRAVWNQYLEYDSKVPTRGAFVVTDSGLGSAYSICEFGSNCRVGIDYAWHAINLCEKEGVKCVVFAEGLNIVVNYEIVD